MKEKNKKNLHWALSCILAAFVVQLGGCASTRTHQAQFSSGEINQEDDALPQTLNVEELTNSPEDSSHPELAQDLIRQEVLSAEANLDFNEVDQQGLEKAIANAGVSQAHPHRIPVEINDLVRKWIHFFAVKDRARFERFLERGEEYREMVGKVLKEKSVPPELYYLAMIESGYVSAATSRASAAGIWQFIAPTGKRYGLRVDQYVDERRDPIRSTKAAASYLKDLHNIFRSWYLAMAAYNAGEYRIIGAIRKSNTRDFWELVEQRVLPQETIHYIPKFLAALIIGKNPERYGFHIQRKRTRYTDVAMVQVPTFVGLDAVAQAAGLARFELKDMNPHLRKNFTPGPGSTYGLWLPQSSQARVEQKTKWLAQFKVNPRERNVASVRSNALRYKPKFAQQRLAKMRKYRVKRGDTLAALADRFGVSVRHIKRVNGLRKERINVGQSLYFSRENI